MVDLVTGGAGFIGSHVVTALCDAGRPVRVFDVRPAPRRPTVEVVSGSVTDRSAVSRAMAGVERVFHLAGLSELWLPDKTAYDAVNVQGTRNVLEAARESGVGRVVATSSATVMIAGRGTGLPSDPVDERRILVPGDLAGPYCRSKLAAEDLARRAAARGQDVVIVNPTLPVGPGGPGLVAPMRMIRDLLGGVDRAYADWTMNLVDVRDAAHGHLLAAIHGRSGQRYLLGGHNLRMSELLDRLATLTGRPMPAIRAPWPLVGAFGRISEWLADHVTRRPPRAPLTGVRLARHGEPIDTSRARRELGYAVRPLEQTLQDTVGWLLRSGAIDAPPPSLARRPSATEGRAA